MKKLIKFLNEKPSYMKCSSKRISEASGVAESTINKYKKNSAYKASKKEYLQSYAK